MSQYNVFTTAQQATASHTSAGNVLMDKYGTGSGTKALSTIGLATCVRIAVVGTYPAGRSGNDRFLAHVSEDSDAPLQGLINSVEQAKRNGMVIDKARVVVGDVSLDTDFDPEKKSDKANEKEQDDFNAKVGRSIKTLVGDSSKIKRKTHAAEDAYQLEITNQKVIRFKQIGGQSWEDSDTEPESD